MLCAKFDQNILNGLFCITFTRLFPYLTIDTKHLQGSTSQDGQYLYNV